MQDTDAPWTPTPGESVRVKATGEDGEVVDVIGGDEARHAVVTMAHTTERREYRIDELGPVFNR